MAWVESVCEVVKVKWQKSIGVASHLAKFNLNQTPCAIKKLVLTSFVFRLPDFFPEKASLKAFQFVQNLSTAFLDFTTGNITENQTLTKKKSLSANHILPKKV